MLAILEKEVVWKYYWLRRMVTFGRGRVFNRSEASGTDMSGQWDQNILNAADVNAYQEGSKLLAFSTEQSKGNFAHDVDGNTLLDLCSTENQPLGHNADAFTALFDSWKYDNAINNAALDASHYSPAELAEKARAVLGPLAPARLQAITLVDGRNATEHAIMDALNKREGDLKVLGFAGSNHGHGLALTQFAHPNMSLGMGWPVVDFPSTDSQESQALEAARNEMRAQKVGAVVIEPTHWQSGAAASDNFINQLGSIARENEAALIVDETNTGCGASGKGFWQYQGDAADYLAFGRRTQATGYFSAETSDQKLNLGGNMIDLHNLEVICGEIQKKNLIDNVAHVSKSMQSGAARVNNSRVKSINVVGNQMWINTNNGQDAAELRDHLRRQGILVRQNGAQGVMARPSLTVQDSHMSQLLSAVAKF